jgi:hypothetical protein
MADQKMIVEYIRRGYRGKRIVKDGIEFVQRHRGPRIGVFVALNPTQFGWSLVHLKGENRELPKDISWSKGVAMAVVRAEGKTGEKIPDSIRRQFEDFQKRAKMTFSEETIPVEGMKDVSIKVANDGTKVQFSIVIGKKGCIRFRDDNFQNLFSAMQQAILRPVVFYKG